MTTNLLSEEIGLCKIHEIQYKDVPFEYIHRVLVNKVDWWWISKYQTLSEDFISKYVDKVDWKEISLYQTLSEDFIEKYKDKVDWRGVFWNNRLNLSNKFRTKYKDRLEVNNGNKPVIR